MKRRHVRTAGLAASHAPYFEGTVAVGVNRHLGYAEFGDPDGKAVLWFHGTPGSRRQVPLETRRWAGEQGIRLIAVERPGIGASTPHLYATVHDFASDVAALAGTLSLQHFGVIGLSGGGPYALSCAAAMPDKVVAVAVFGGVAPTHGADAPEGGLVQKALPAERWLSRCYQPIGAMLGQCIRALHPIADPIFDAVVRFGPRSETTILGELEFRAMFVDDLMLGTQQGRMSSIVHDIILFARPWGFALSDIHVPVHFWQGTDDPLVPLNHAIAQARRIAGADVTVCEDQGHLAGLQYSVEALQFITRHWPDKRKRQRTKTKPRTKKKAAPKAASRTAR
ncbi:MAG: alpha/beta hydrolase [Gammaproteobacteria bacterium]|nr:MAG: alpha/beta hydrolase [Gammaproteobacteria bacterium]